MPKRARASAGDNCVFFGSILAAVCLFSSALPMLPWRYAEVDSNVGDRFTQGRKYTLMGATNQFGKPEGWFTLRKKIQDKVEEFGKPGPLTALVGTVTTETEQGGAAMGCALWRICKEHATARSESYWQVASTGVACLVMLILGAFASGSVPIVQSMEEPAGQKKKSSSGMDSRAMTMICVVFAFLLPTAATGTFVYVLGEALKDLQKSAYYPYARLDYGVAVASAGCVLNFLVLIVAMSRAGKRDEGPQISNDRFVRPGSSPGKGAPRR